jgi:hypothetical protein
VSATGYQSSFRVARELSSAGHAFRAFQIFDFYNILAHLKFRIALGHRLAPDFRAATVAIMWRPTPGTEGRGLSWGS